MLLDPSHVSEKTIAAPGNEQFCGRDDRGQEPTIDVDAALTMAPHATIDVRYDDVCLRGGEGTLALQRALDDDPSPDVIVFPFAVAPLYDRLERRFGPPPIAYLEAALRGIPIVVPAGDDGALRHSHARHEPGRGHLSVRPPVRDLRGRNRRSATRSARHRRRPLERRTHATGGGISVDPRPRWQIAPMDFEFSPDVVKNRIVPDVSADAVGSPADVLARLRDRRRRRHEREHARCRRRATRGDQRAGPAATPAALGRRSLRAGASAASRGVPRRRQRATTAATSTTRCARVPSAAARLSRASSRRRRRRQVRNVRPTGATSRRNTTRTGIGRCSELRRW